MTEICQGLLDLIGGWGLVALIFLGFCVAMCFIARAKRIARIKFAERIVSANIRAFHANRSGDLKALAVEFLSWVMWLCALETPTDDDDELFPEPDKDFDV